ncbi:hypothetical protein ACSVDA_06550 [Cytobacillus sp. Hm23]
MRVFEKVTIKTESVTQVTCNCCGKQAEVKAGDYAQAYHPITAYINYEQSSFDLCDECLIEFARSFKIKPEGAVESKKSNAE